MSRGGTVGRVVSAVAGMLVIAGFGAGPAAAHDELLASDPADGATVDVAPDRVVLTFSAPAVDLGTQVVITGPDAVAVGDGPAQVDGATVVQALGATRPAGDYRVDWRVTSEDGHPVTGTLTFTAAAGTTPDSAPAAASTQVPGPSAVAAPTSLPTRAVAAPAPAPSPTATSDAAGGGFGGGRAFAVLAAVAAVLILVRLGRSASLRHRTPGAPTTPDGPSTGAV